MKKTWLAYGVLAIAIAWVFTAEVRAKNAMEAALEHEETADSIALENAGLEARVADLLVEVEAQDSMITADSVATEQERRQLEAEISIAVSSARTLETTLRASLDSTQAMMLDSVTMVYDSILTGQSDYIDSLEDQAAMLFGTRATLQETVAQLQIQVAGKDEEIAALRASLDESFSAVSALETAKRRQGLTLTALGVAGTAAVLLLR